MSTVAYFGRHSLAERCELPGTANDHSITISGLSPNTSYQIAVRSAVDGDDDAETRWSQQFQLTTLVPDGTQNVIRADDMPGHSIGEKIQRAIDSFSSFGGVVDATGFSGVQISDGFSIDRPRVTITFGAIILHLTSAIEIDSDNVGIIGAGADKTIFINDIRSGGHCALRPGLVGDDVIRSSACANSIRYSGTVLVDFAIDGNRISPANPAGIDPNVGLHPTPIASIARDGDGVVCVRLGKAALENLKIGDPIAIAGVYTNGFPFDGVYQIEAVNVSSGTLSYLQSGEAAATGDGGEAGIFDDILQNGYNGTADAHTSIIRVLSHNNYGMGVCINGNGDGESDGDSVFGIDSADNGESGLLLVCTTGAVASETVESGNGMNSISSGSGVQFDGSAGCDVGGASLIDSTVTSNLGNGVYIVDARHVTIHGDDVERSGLYGIQVANQLFGSGGEIISQNYVSNAKWCIGMEDDGPTGGGDVLQGNTLTQCRLIGLTIAGSNDTRVLGGSIEMSKDARCVAGVLVNGSSVALKGIKFGPAVNAPDLVILGQASDTQIDNLVRMGGGAPVVVDSGKRTVYMD